MKSIPAAKFKNQCLSLLEEVQRTCASVIVTRHGKPVAQIGPVTERSTRAKNPLKGSIDFEGDLIAPIDGAWEALS